MAAIKCLICGYEATDGRVMHGHLMKNHEEEYRKAELDMEKLTSGYKRTRSNTAKKTKKALETEKPAGLRLLNKNNKEEHSAYMCGYRYIDADENVYTTSELKEMGVI